MTATRRWLVVVNWRDRSHPDAGGAELVCERLAAHFVREGWDVVHLSAAVTGRPRDERRGGIRYVRRGGRFGVYPKSLLWLVRHRRSIAAVVDSQNGIPFFTPLAVARQTPVLLLLHHVHQDQFAMYFPRPVAAIGRFLEGPVSRLVYGRRAIVAVSPSTRRDARARLGLRGEILVAPPGAGPVRDCSAARADHPEICWLGRLVPHKRVDVLLEAFARLVPRWSGARLHLVGDGPLGDDLRAEVARRGLEEHVVFHGVVSDAERDSLLARSWLLVSTSAHEGWGLTVIEANAVGTPVLALRRPGLRDSVRAGETGWLVEDDAGIGPALDGALRELSDTRQAACYAQRARGWAAAFTWEEMGRLVSLQLRAESERLATCAAPRPDAVTLVVLERRHLPPQWSLPLGPMDHAATGETHFAYMLRGVEPAGALDLLTRSGAGSALGDSALVRPADDDEITAAEWTVHRHARAALGAGAMRRPAERRSSRP